MELDPKSVFSDEIVVPLHAEDLLDAEAVEQTVVPALKRETSTIPIVFAVAADPVGSGFVASLPRPGGNVTGFSSMEGSMASKWLSASRCGRHGRRRAHLAGHGRFVGDAG
jgi:ABC transporter substrate binding protein